MTTLALVEVLALGAPPEHAEARSGIPHSALGAANVLAPPPTYRLRVDGLACPFCAYGIEKKLKAIDGVAHVETNIRDGTVLVTMKDDITLDELTAQKAVKEAGFTLNEFGRVTPDEGGSDGARTG